jgi:hypothetical protein
MSVFVSFMSVGVHGILQSLRCTTRLGSIGIKHCMELGRMSVICICIIVMETPSGVIHSALERSNPSR